MSLDRTFAFQQQAPSWRAVDSAELDPALEQSMIAQQERIKMLARLAPQVSNVDNISGLLSNKNENGDLGDTTLRFTTREGTLTSANSLSTSGPSSTRRIDAIAKLRRAASQRETKSKGTESTANGRHTPLEDGRFDSSAASIFQGDEGSHSTTGAMTRVETASPFLTRPFGADGSKSVSPIPPGMLRLEQLRSGSLSPQIGLREGASTPESGSLLNRSRSQRGDARSPLPSLEQLRARILHERATAGLARSASTSAASAAARAYALEKLLGESPRQGAISPVSDTAEDQEEKSSRSTNPDGLAAPRDSQRPLLRRSRTIGGLSAAAEAQRKAAFVQALDEGVPEDVKSLKRSSRRFAKAPPGGRLSTSSKPSDPPIYEESHSLNNISGHLASKAGLSSDEAEVETDTQAQTDGDTNATGVLLDRSQSQRQIARAEMLRKLSGRGRAGQNSPLPPAVRTSTASDQDKRQHASPQEPFNSNSYLAPFTPPAAAPLALASYAPGSNLLTVPGSSNYNTMSPSNRSSIGMASQHEADRNRASEMARLMGEEAFEYERLLEMGYSTDDAFERVASARSGSYVDLSNNVSPRSYQGDFLPTENDSQLSPARSHADHSPRGFYTEEEDVQELAAPSSASISSSAQMKSEEWVNNHLSFASIPVGLDARRSSNESALNRGAGETIELLNGDDVAPSRRRAAWPESVASANTFDSRSSPKRSGSIKRDSEGGISSIKSKPSLLTLPSMTVMQRIEDVLTPGFLQDIGNPLDYSASPTSATGEQSLKQGHFKGDDNDSISDAEPRDDNQWNENDESYLDEVDRMTRRLGQFTRRNNSTSASRMMRDAAVQQSSAAQLIAAASDVARRDASMADNTSTFSAANFTSPPEHQQLSTSAIDSVRPPPSSRNDSPSASLKPMQGTMTHSATNSAESYPYMSNGKLSPFPGLLPTPSPGTELLSSDSLSRRPSPLKLIPTAPLAKAVNFADEDTDIPLQDKKDEAGTSKSPGFFTTLRRKASNATSRGNGSNGNSTAINSAPAVPPSKGLGSLLRRKTSEKLRLKGESEPQSPNASLNSVTSTITSKQGARNEDGFFAASSLAPAASAALHRYSKMLTSPAGGGTFTDIPGLTREDIEDPPRRFLFAIPVLQIMTLSTVKDRYLFVFSDLLVLAKPVAPPRESIDTEALPTLEWTFSVKEILDIGQIKQLLVPTDERRRPSKNVALMDAFVKEFRWNPQQAIDSVIEQSQLPQTPSTIALLLHQTPELDRQRLTDYLFNDILTPRREVAKAFIELEKFSGVSIESALRSLLLEIRFPSHREAFENLLVTFAAKWVNSNKDLIKEAFSEQIAVDLVFAIMSLNDALHSETHATPAMFSNPMPACSKDDFLQSFRLRDEGLILSDRTLSRIYTSISHEAIQQSLHVDEVGPRYIPRILSPGIPVRLIYGLYSNPIRISIPQIDPDFVIRLYGEDLAFQPQVLSFDQSNTQEFKVMSKNLGPKNIVFIKAGKNARYYQMNAKANCDLDYALPRFISVVVERAFKQHCFTVVYPGNKRLTLSVEGDLRKNRCVDTIKDRMAHMSDLSFRNGSYGNAHGLAMHVLREALIEPEVSASLQRSASAAVPGNSSRLEMSTLNRAPSDSRAFVGGTGLSSRAQISNMNRKESVSKHYYQSQGKREKELAPLIETNEIAPQNHSLSLQPLLGEELIVTVKQNSLLSIVVARLKQETR